MTSTSKPSRRAAQVEKAPVGKLAPSRHQKLAAPNHEWMANRTRALHRSLGFSLRMAQLSTYTEFLNAMAPFDIRPAQFSVLVIIQTNPGLTQAAVCSALGIQKTNFVTLLDGLELRGLTERRKAGTDRRSYSLHLTAAGEELVQRMVVAHDLLERRLMRRLGAGDTRRLLDLLHRFAQSKP